MACNCRKNVLREVVWMIGDVETTSVAEASRLARETGLRPRRVVREKVNTNA